jgi:hypothetical protein
VHLIAEAVSNYLFIFRLEVVKQQNPNERNIHLEKNKTLKTRRKMTTGG